MRTTVDLPDALVKRIKFYTTNNKVTFRSLLIAALEKELPAEKKPSAITTAPPTTKFSHEMPSLQNRHDKR